MSGIHFTTFETICFGSSRPLEEKQMRDLVQLFNRPTSAADAVLGGRASVARHAMDGVGPVVIKFYRRGGFIRHFNEKTYLRTGKTRGQREYEMMDTICQLGIRVPRPVAFAYRGFFFCQCWLVTAEIERHQTLASLSGVDPKQAVPLVSAVAGQVNRLVQHRIHHVDLHPGNVLIDRQQEVFLVDFDRARHSRLAPQELRRRYARRWQSAVNKHRLPKALSRAFEAALFQ